MSKSGKQAFPGGVHPTDGFDKAQTMEKPVQIYRPDTVTILSEQTIGGTCEFQVQPGDRVKEGQQIGSPAAFMAAPLPCQCDRNRGGYPGSRRSGQEDDGLHSETGGGNRLGEAKLSDRARGHFRLYPE